MPKKLEPETPIYLELLLEKKWDIPHIKLPNKNDDWAAALDEGPFE